MEPPPEEVPIVVRQQSLFWLLVCMCGRGLPFTVCLRPSGVLIISLARRRTKRPPPPRVVSFAEQAVQKNGQRSAFLRVFEQSWPALHVTVSFALSLGRGPSVFFFFPFFSTSPIHLLHLHLRMAPCCQCRENMDCCPSDSCLRCVHAVLSQAARDLSILSSKLSCLKM